MEKKLELQKLKKRQIKMLLCVFISLLTIVGVWRIGISVCDGLWRNGYGFIIFAALLAFGYFYISYRIYSVKIDAIIDELANQERYWPRTTAANVSN